MSYVLDGVEAPTLEALDAALARRGSLRALGAMSSATRLSRATTDKEQVDRVREFVVANKSFVRRYLQKYGATDRGFSKGTTIVVNKRRIDLSRASVNRANNEKLAAMLLASLAHDSIHALRIAASVATGLGTLGEDAMDAEQDAQDLVQFQQLVQWVVDIGPGVMGLIDTLFGKSEVIDAASAKATTTKGARALAPLSTSTSSLPTTTQTRMGVHPAVYLVGALAVAGAIYWLLSQKK